MDAGSDARKMIAKKTRRARGGKRARKTKADKLAADTQASQPKPFHSVQYGSNGAPAVAPTSALGSFAATATSASSPSPSSNANSKTGQPQQHSTLKRKAGLPEIDNDNDSPGPPPKKKRVSANTKIDHVEDAKKQVENGLKSLLLQHHALQKKNRAMKAKLRDLGEEVSNDDDGDE